MIRQTVRVIIAGTGARGEEVPLGSQPYRFRLFEIDTPLPLSGPLTALLIHGCCASVLKRIVRVLRNARVSALFEDVAANYELVKDGLLTAFNDVDTVESPSARNRVGFGDADA